MTLIEGSEKPLVWNGAEVKTPPLSSAARVEMGWLLRRLQRGEMLSLPASRPMPSVGKGCHELRVREPGSNWRLIYRIDLDAIVVLAIFAKKTETTPKSVIDQCRRRLREYDKWQDD